MSGDSHEQHGFLSGPPDDWKAYRRYLYLLPKLLFYCLLVYLAFLLFRQASGLIFMLFISLLTAYILDPVVDWFEARGINRSFGILILVTICVSAGVGFISWIVPTLISEFSNAGDRIQHLFDKDPAQFIDWAANTLGIEVSESLMVDLKLKAQEYAPQVIAGVTDFLQGALARTLGVVGWFLNVVMVPVFIFYFLRDFDLMKAWVADQIPLKRREFVLKRAKRVDGVIGSWLRGQVQLALILAVMYAIGLGFTGIKLAVPIGIITGILCVVPFLGLAFGIGLTCLMLMLDWQGGDVLIAVISVFVVIQLFESYLLTPRIVGEKVGLSPAAVLIALLLGGEMFGFLGFLLAVPVAGAAKTIGVELIDWYQHSRIYTGEEEPEDTIIIAPGETLAD